MTRKYYFYSVVEEGMNLKTLLIVRRLKILFACSLNMFTYMSIDIVHMFTYMSKTTYMSMVALPAPMAAVRRYL